jgi:hypothetical protein
MHIFPNDEIPNPKPFWSQALPPRNRIAFLSALKIWLSN